MIVVTWSLLNCSKKTCHVIRLVSFKCFQKLSASDALKQALRDAGCADQVFEDGEGEEEEEEEEGGDGESETESFTEVFQTATRYMESFEQFSTTHVGSKLLRYTQFLYERTNSLTLANCTMQ